MERAWNLGRNYDGRFLCSCPANTGHSVAKKQQQGLANTSFIAKVAEVLHAPVNIFCDVEVGQDFGPQIPQSHPSESMTHATRVALCKRGRQHFLLHRAAPLHLPNQGLLLLRRGCRRARTSASGQMMAHHPKHVSVDLPELQRRYSSELCCCCCCCGRCHEL